MTTPDLEQRAIDVIRGLALDGPNAARSGHQGTAMALAPLAHVLWTRVMNYDAEAPDWPDRDRFVLSNGHASILLYSMLYLTGYGLTLDDLKAFRQWGSRTPGHPEAGHTVGVEVTTGPLGQGVANGVGFGLAERWLRSQYGADVVDHHTFVIAGDGCLEEGISHEAASLAGHLGLGRLVYVYDDNHVSIDGPTELALDDDPVERFEAYGWHVENVGEIANDLDGLEAAIRRAMEVDDAPSLVVLRSHIAYPSPDHTDDYETHGYALKDAEITATKAVMGIPDEPFWVPDDVLELYRQAGRRGRERAPGLAGPPRRLDGRPGLVRRGPGRRRPGRVGGQAAHLQHRRPDRHPGGQRHLPQRHRRGGARADARLGRPDRQHRGEAERRRRPSPPAIPAGARCTTASASTAWAAS